MNQPKVDPTIAFVIKPAGLLPWKRGALATLSQLTADSREVIISTCGLMAIREAEREPSAKRLAFQLVKGGLT
jgi:hypothetical protein